MANNHYITPTNIRINNEMRIIHELYWNEQLTIQELSEITQLSNPTINGVIQILKKHNVIVEGNKLISTGGRRPIKLAFNYNYKYSIGVEIRKNDYEIVLINLHWEMVKVQSFNYAFENTKQYWHEINSNIHLLVDDFIESSDIIGVGISFPGEISVNGDIIERAISLGITNQPLPQIRNQFDWPVYIENGANTAGLAAVWRRREISDAIYLIITNSGVAGSIILNREIFHAPSGSKKSGAFGHMILKQNGKKCFCGANGCWSAYARIDNLTQYSNGSLEAFFDKVDQGNKKCTDAWDEYLNYLAQGIINIKQSIDLDIIIGGPLSPYLDNYLSAILERVSNHPSLYPIYTSISIDNLKGNALSIGAAIIFIERIINGKIPLIQD